MSTKQLKFPVLNAVEYFEVVKDKQAILILSGEEVENKTWREIQLLIGEKVGTGYYQYNFKFKRKKLRRKRIYSICRTI